MSAGKCQVGMKFSEMVESSELLLEAPREKNVAQRKCPMFLKIKGSRIPPKTAN